MREAHTGIGQHSIGLLRELTKMKGVRCTIAVPEKIALEGIPPKCFHVIKPLKIHRAFARWYWEKVQVPRFFAAQKFTFEYYPYPCPLPKVSRNPRALTVHDLILLKDKRYKSNALKSLYYKDSFKSLRYVDQIFTVSDTIRKELGQDAELLYNGVPTPPKLTNSKTKHQLVYLGGYDIRKNVAALIKAVELLPPQFKLLLIGEAHHNSKFYPGLPDSKRVIKAGKLSDAEVYKTLAESYAFVHFSDSEGFNIPLVQAMLAGTPAIVNDIPVNREVSQNAAMFIDSSRPEDLAAKIQMLKSPHVRKSLTERAKKIAKTYTWAKAAKKLIKTMS